MACLKQLCDHVETRFVRGHIVVTAAVVFRSIAPPWRFHLWLPREYCKKNGARYVKMTALAAETIAGFTPPEGLGVGVLFDAFDLSPAVTKSCLPGRQRQIGDLGPGLLEHHEQRVRMRCWRGWRWMCMAAVNGRLRKIGTVRVVSMKRPRERWKNTLAIITNATEMSARTIIAN